MGSMLQLNAEQVTCLQKIQMERDVGYLSGVLAKHFPEIQARLGDRFGMLIALAVQRGAAHGLTHMLCVARYLACWSVLGAEFEAKPGFEWAQDILSSPGRTQGAKVFQLCRQTRETLAQLNPQQQSQAGRMSADQFDQALAVLDEALMDRGTLGSLQRGGRVALGQACDIDAIDIRLADPLAIRQYVLDQGQWQYLPGAPAQDAVTLVADRTRAQSERRAGEASATDSAALPQRLALLSPSTGAKPARMRVRTLAASCCDPLVHPLVTFSGPLGQSEWRGALAGDVHLELHAEAPAEPSAGALRPSLALAGAARVSMLTLSSCGVRDSGTPIAEQSTRIEVRAADQHLLAWRREPATALDWPTPPAGPQAAPAARCRVERDGVAFDSSRWQAGLEELDRKLGTGLDRLFRDWERTSGVTSPRMRAEPAVMCGDAGLSWGWTDGPGGMQADAFFRILGRMELIACQMNLALGGTWTMQGASCSLSLQCHGRTALQSTWERGAVDAELLPSLTPTQTSFRHPFVLQLEASAQAEAATLGCGPVTGALVGSCGLRARSDGMGLQWFAKIGIEPVQAKVHWHDPLLGLAEINLPLLPALDLLDWSLG